MNAIPRRLLTDTVSVLTYQGEGAYGPVFAAKSVSVSCRAEAERQLVRNANGEEVVSELRLFVHPDDAAPVTVGSLVTFAGRQSTVLGVSPKARPGEVHHVEVSCT
jgi:hypothetical protein